MNIMHWSIHYFRLNKYPSKPKTIAISVKANQFLLSVSIFVHLEDLFIITYRIKYILLVSSVQTTQNYSGST